MGFFGVSLNFVPKASALLASPWFCPSPAVLAGKLEIFHQLQRAPRCAPDSPRVGVTCCGPAVEAYMALSAIQSWWLVRLCGHWLKQATWT